jgi:hypothetical protein
VERYIGQRNRKRNKEQRIGNRENRKVNRKKRRAISRRNERKQSNLTPALPLMPPLAAWLG